MKNSFILLVFFTTMGFSQVGIGTVTPSATLEIKSTNEATPSNTDGILIPKIEEFPITVPTAAQDGMLVYVTGAGSISKGFYYWDNVSTVWVNSMGAKNINDLNDGLTDASNSSLFIGSDAGVSDDGSGNQNIGIGFETLHTSTTGYQNNAIGFQALYSNTTGAFNVANGTYALFSNTIGNYNTAIGAYALPANINGHSNTAVGRDAMYANDVGFENTAVGHKAMELNFGGTRNTAIGVNALSSNVSGSNNIAIGAYALNNLSSSFNNVAIGQSAGLFVDGNNNILIGYQAGAGGLSHVKEGSVMIGYQSGLLELNSDRLYIENSSSTAPLIYGEFDNDLVAINGSLGVGTQTPTVPLHITEDGTSNVQTIVAGLGSSSSNRPVLQFSETANMGLSEGMSLEYNGTGSGSANRMVINNVGGSPLFEFRNGGDLTLNDGDIIVRGTATDREIRLEDDAGNPDRALMRQTSTQDIYVGDIDDNAGDLYIRAGGSTEVAVIAGTGFVGINTTNPAYTLEVNGNAAKPGGGSWTNVSDRRLKKNIQAYTPGLKTLLQIKPVSYQYNIDSGFDTEKTHVGVVAQDLQKAAPSMVTSYQKAGTEYLAVNNSEMTYLLINAVKEQQAEIAALKETIIQLNIKIDAIK